jgi:D-beta-D-heptose 7-phosphate kinase/D-beta-D-heptose 1-phosphate adenosyltransferase
MPPDNINAMIEPFDKLTVLVIGDFMLDRFIYGEVSRISPEAPIPLIDISREVLQLGGAANAVKNISSLGGKTIAVGVVGDDWFGKRLTCLLEDAGINVDGIIDCKDRPTTVKTRLIAGNQQLIRFDRENRDPIDADLVDVLINFVEQKIDSVDVILISDYNKGVITRVLLERLVSLNKKYNKPMVVYPKVDPSFNYKGVTLLLTNQDSACSVTGIKQINETSLRNMGHWLLSHLEPQNVLILHGRKGMSHFDEKGNVTQIPNTLKESRNITGTIDTVAGLISLSLPVCKSEIHTTLHLATVGMTIVSRKAEDRTVTRQEIIQTLKEI